MVWAKPENSEERVNFTGKAVSQLFFADSALWDLAEREKYDGALGVVNNWRACHGYPLNTFQINLFGFKQAQLGLAEKQYAEAEARAKSLPGTDAVLVAVESLQALPRAYPNYFADTKNFIGLLKRAINGQ